jgi:hypothetical protein
MGQEWAFQRNTDGLIDAKAKSYQAFCDIWIGEREWWRSRVSDGRSCYCITALAWEVCINASVGAVCTAEPSMCTPLC